MRIDEKLPARSVDKKAQRSESGKGSGARPSPFSTALVKSGDLLVDRAVELEELKKEIDLAGDNLERDPSMAHFKEFRELLTSMARKVTAEAYRVELLSGSPRAPAYHEIITVIDKHADSLYRLIMSEQKDRIKIAAKIQEIRGLLVSLTL